MAGSCSFSRFSLPKPWTKWRYLRKIDWHANSLNRTVWQLVVHFGVYYCATFLHLRKQVLNHSLHWTFFIFRSQLAFVLRFWSKIRECLKLERTTFRASVACSTDYAIAGWDQVFSCKISSEIIEAFIGYFVVCESFATHSFVQKWHAVGDVLFFFCFFYCANLLNIGQQNSVT